MSNIQIKLNAILVFGLVFNSFIYAQNAKEFPVLKGDYLGQTPPGDTPVVFARGIISDNYQQHGAPSFSPDGNQVFWQTNRRPENENEKWLTFSMTMRRTGDIWTAPEVSPYGSMPLFSPDGKRIYFAGKEEGDDPYFVEKQGNSWSEPKSLGLVARFPELKEAFFPSIARNGTIYFMGYVEGQWNNYGIYRAELINGVYAKPELLSPSINTPGGMRNWAPFIAPDESYLIFCSTRGLPEYDQGDLHICFRQPDGSWTDPVSMGAPINTNQMERFSALSPDGRYLFFTRDTPGYDEDVYWVSAGIIEKLKAKTIQELRLKQ
jgi:Tol biopolymer transport system component